MIFVGGVHGVGKTYFSEKMSLKYNYRHYSASDLINFERNSSKKVDDLEGNQEQLIKNVLALKEKSDKFILDGHFCLINESGDIERVPEETFIKLAPRIIVVLKADTKFIKGNLLTRDRYVQEEKFLAKFQEEECLYATEIAEKLGCRIEFVSMPINTKIDDLGHVFN